MTLSPRVVVITGGSSGLGRCTASLFAQKGWNVGLIARGVVGLAASAADVRAFGSRAAFAVADVTDSLALHAAASEIADILGPPDIWINCAGNGVYGSFTDVPEADFERVTAVTYGGTVNGCRVAFLAMAPSGSGTIVNVCSAIAFYGMPLMSSYAGAKAAVRGFGQALQGELRIKGSRIRVCTVFPPAVNTPFFAHSVSHMGWPARPAPMVYQPEVVAKGIYLAAIRGAPEAVISGTAFVFSLATRYCPWLVAFAMSRLGMEGQLQRGQESSATEDPTLYHPPCEASPVHGGFDDRARGWSIHLWLSQHAGRNAAALMTAAIRWATRRPTSPSRAIPHPEEQH